MTTTVISPEVSAPAVLTAAGRRLVSLRRAFWLRIKQVVTPAIGFLRSVGSKALGLVPAPVLGLAASIPFVTRWGFGMAAKGVAYVGGLAGWTIRTGAAFVHNGIDWLGNRLADFVGIFSASGAAKVRSGVASFSTTREMAAGYVRQQAGAVADRVMGALTSPFTRTAVGVTAGTVAGTIALNMAAPATFAALLASLPMQGASVLATVSMGGLAALGPIAAVAGIATLAVLAVNLFARTAPELISAEVEADLELDAELVTVDGHVDGVLLTEEQAKTLADQEIEQATLAGTGKPVRRDYPAKPGKGKGK
jgi:hypothetical protein